MAWQASSITAMPPLPPQRHQRVEVGGVAVEVDGEDGLRPRRDRRRDRRRRDVQGRGIEVREHRARARAHHGQRGKGGGEGRRDHLVARADAQPFQRELDGLGAVGDRDHLPRPQPGRELALEGFSLRPQDEPPGVQHPRHRGVDLGAHRPDVGLEVDEGDGGHR